MEWTIALGIIAIVLILDNTRLRYKVAKLQDEVVSKEVEVLNKLANQNNKLVFELLDNKDNSDKFKLGVSIWIIIQVR